MARLEPQPQLDEPVGRSQVGGPKRPGTNGVELDDRDAHGAYRSEHSEVTVDAGRGGVGTLPNAAGVNGSAAASRVDMALVRSRSGHPAPGSVWMTCSANFALTEFSEVRIANGIYESVCTRSLLAEPLIPAAYGDASFRNCCLHSQACQKCTCPCLYRHRACPAAHLWPKESRCHPRHR